MELIYPVRNFMPASIEDAIVPWRDVRSCVMGTRGKSIATVIATAAAVFAIIFIAAHVASWW
jgi:hypothetical protein